ncbi:MAG: hypothetical protein PF638_02530 [Candidatus Delongbacteria bacterium]|jgi:hypothetical protein|nr:hypothetical protein [Candidatus Delongbacteria bacterium]
MRDYSILMWNEIFVLRKDRRVRIKLILSFMIILYVLFFSFFEKNSNVLSFYFFGFFFISPLIDFSFYLDRIKKRFPRFLGMGYSLRQIILTKTIVIFSLGLIFGVLFSSLALYFGTLGILSVNFEHHHVAMLLSITLYNFWIILISGLIQTRYEIIFPVRLFNILVFILFINFNNSIDTIYETDILQKHFPLGMIFIILLTVFLIGKLNKDKIA